MRDIYLRYAPRELQQELKEGLVSKHKEMPQIQFSQEDADAILWYLYDLAKHKWAEQSVDGGRSWPRGRAGPKWNPRRRAGLMTDDSGAQSDLAG